MREFKWQPVTRKQLLRQVTKYKKLLHLRDWDIKLCTSSIPPREVKLYLAEQGYDNDTTPPYRVSGEVYPRPDMQTAYIWVPIVYSKDEDKGGTNASEALFHEMLHIFFAAYAHDEELRVRVLSEAVFPLL